MSCGFSILLTTEVVLKIFPNLNVVGHLAVPAGWGSCLLRLAIFFSLLITVRPGIFLFIFVFINIRICFSEYSYSYLNSKFKVFVLNLSMFKKCSHSFYFFECLLNFSVLLNIL